MQSISSSLMPTRRQSKECNKDEMQQVAKDTMTSHSCTKPCGPTTPTVSTLKEHIFKDKYSFYALAEFILIKGVARGKGGKSPPRNRKNCCRKMVLFPKVLFLVTNFRKNNKNKNKKIQFFYRIFIKKFQNFFKISQQFVFFVPRAKIDPMPC